uniref:Transposase DDE domain-containing protein n=1 Tax=Rhodopseudomonas palustris (strain BisA53) TaxID=316055 RepID=Q07TT4_RHOP5
MRSRSVTPHIAIDGHLSKTGKPRKTAIDRRTLRHAGYAVSQRCRKRIEEVFGWIKASAGLAKVKLRGRARVDAAFNLALAAYNLIRLPKLLGQQREAPHHRDAIPHPKLKPVACRPQAAFNLDENQTSSTAC